MVTVNPLRLAIPIIVLVLSSLAAGVSTGRAAATQMARARLISDSRQIAPGQKFRLGLMFSIADESHIYWRNPGDAGLATHIEWKLPQGFVAGPLFWPAPVRLEEPGDLSVNAYTDSVLLFSWVQAPTMLDTKEVTLGVRANWLACRKICVQEADSSSISLAVGDSPLAGPDYPRFEHFAALVPQPAEGGRQIRGRARWTESRNEPNIRIGVLVMEAEDKSLRLVDDDGSAVFFGDPSPDLECENFHLDTRRSSPAQLVLHVRVRRLRGRQWPVSWGGVFRAQALAADGDTLTLALQYNFSGKSEYNP